MAIIAFDVNQVRDYTSPQDKGENKTVFKIGVLDSRLFYYLQDRSRTFGVNNLGPDAPATVNLDVETRNYKVVKYGLRGWENLLDNNGKEVSPKFRPDSLPNVGTRQGLTDDSMDMIKLLIPELAAEILKDNTFTPDEERGF